MGVPEHMTPKMVAALRYLATVDRPVFAGEIAREIGVQHRKGSYLGQPKVFGGGSAGAMVARALVRRGLATEEYRTRYAGTRYEAQVTGWEITEAGRQKLSEVSESIAS